MTPPDRYIVLVRFETQWSAASFAARVARKLDLPPQDVELASDDPEVSVDLRDRQDLVEVVERMAKLEEYGFDGMEVL